MAPRFDQRRTKHQLFHVSISLATVLISMTYLQYRRNWKNIGNFWESFLVPITFIGEIMKVILARFYGRIEDGVLTVKQRQKKAQYFTAQEMGSGLFLQFLCTLLYGFTCIILGAPVLHNYEQTFILALLLTSLTVSPTVFLLGGNGALQVVFCEKPDFLTKSEETALDLFKYNAIGALFGAWIASATLPLDWDREWQEYPIPNVIGAVLGSAMGNIYCCTRILYATAKVYINRTKTMC